MNKLYEFRRMAIQALQIHDSLVSLWRDILASDFAEASSEDIKLLESLILRRIYPLNSFEILVNLSPESAIEMLLARYLGKSVDPDRKFGGFEFELESMLDDLCNIAGQDQLSNLVNHENFATSSLEDARVRRSFAEALGLDESQISDWVESHLKQIE